MALVKLGGGVVGISGSIAGNTFARNRSGAYMRARTKPVNPQSARQVAARGRVSFSAEWWHDFLSAANRLSWESYANAVGWTNKLGESIHLTGFNMYMRTACYRLQVGLAAKAPAPVLFSLPNADPVFSCALSEANGITVTFDDAQDWCDEGAGRLSFEIGTPQLPTRTFFNGPWRYDNHIKGNDVAPPASPDGPTALTSWTVTEGQLVWVRARIHRSDGRVTNHFGHQAVTVGA